MKLQHFLWMALLFLTCQKQSKNTSTLPFEAVESPSRGFAHLPHLVRGANDSLYMSWVEKEGATAQLKFATWTGTSWTEPSMIARGNDWFVNWADYPMLAVDPHGNKLAHYLSKSSAGNYSYDVNLMIQPIDSSHWIGPIVPHNDGTPTEHGFVTMLPSHDSTFTVAWLDGRNTDGGHSHHDPSGAMTFRTAQIDLSGNISGEAELDNRVCECCQTRGVVTEEGILFVYRDRSVDEVRDMAFVKQTTSGWSIPKLVAIDNWKIEGCPVNGPSIASDENALAIAWYTGAMSSPMIKLAFKVGNEFMEPIVIDDVLPLGRVDVVMLDRHTAVVSWLDGGDLPAIKFRSARINGALSPIYLVAETSEERSSGFPQMEVLGNQLFFAWTDVGDSSSAIQIKTFQTDEL